MHVKSSFSFPDMGPFDAHVFIAPQQNKVDRGAAEAITRHAGMLRTPLQHFRCIASSVMHGP